MCAHTHVLAVVENVVAIIREYDLCCQGHLY